jgi:hypothetical protein
MKDSERLVIRPSFEIFRFLLGNPAPDLSFLKIPARVTPGASRPQ